MKFLASCLPGEIANALFESCHQLTESAGDGLCIAIAYWGDGGVELLGLDPNRNKNARFICDLRSGACNPTVIDQLRTKFGKQAVRTTDALHAKVIIGSSAILVGSANASANGLGAREEITGLIEAAVLVEDDAAIAAARDWFEKVWRRGQPITDAEIKAAAEKWRSRWRPRPTSASALSDARGDDLRELSIISYESEDLSDEADQLATETGLYTPDKEPAVIEDDLLSLKKVFRPGMLLIEAPILNSGPYVTKWIWEVAPEPIRLRSKMAIQPLFFRKETTTPSGVRIKITHSDAKMIQKFVKEMLQVRHSRRQSGYYIWPATEFTTWISRRRSPSV